MKFAKHSCLCLPDAFPDPWGRCEALQRSRLAAAAQLLLLGLAFASVSPAAAAIRVEAYSGFPFGVGRISFDVDRDQPSQPDSDERFTVESQSGRILYPVLQQRPARRLLRRFLGVETPLNAAVYFLFNGPEPLEVNVYSPRRR
ncbi:MAG: hypothetical protein AAF961_12820, partial [Planctomycetota bacterium]